MPVQHIHIDARQFCGLLVALLVACMHTPAQAQDQPVNLELVLLVDVSASVNDEEFHLQASGLAAAFESARVIGAIESMPAGGLAICIVQWADNAHQEVSVDWTVLRTRTDALQLSTRIRSIERQIHGGHTALGDALAFGLNEIRTNRFTGVRRVIDLSGDGRSNDGRSLFRSRQEVLDDGITINGLAILNELPLLADYFRSQLIGGDGAFVETARDYSDFARAMSRKLEREIRSMPLAGDVHPSQTLASTASSL